MAEQTEQPIAQDSTSDQSEVSTGINEFAFRPFNIAKQLASFFNINLRKDLYRNLTRNVHISHWKQLHEPLIPPPRDGFALKLSKEFRYSKGSGWDNSRYPFIPPMEDYGDDPLGPEFPREAPLGQFLNQLTEFTARIMGAQGLRRIWLPQHDTPIDSRRKPGLVLVDSQHQTVAGSKWEHVRSVCQIKYRDTPDLVEEAYEQLYDIASFIFTKQDSRLFLIGFSICGASLRAYLFHRGGTMVSTPMSFHTEPWAVAQALVAIACTEFIHIGYDPTIHTPSALMQVALAPILMSNPWNRTIKTVFVFDGIPEDMELIIDACLFSSRSMQGRGTRVFACLHPKYEEYLRRVKLDEGGSDQKAKGMAEVDPKPGYSGLTHCIVKDCWVDHPNRSDYYIHDLLKKRNLGEDGMVIDVEPQGIAIYVRGHVDQVSLNEDEDKNSSYFEPRVLPDVKMRKMIHKRFVFQTCGVGIQWFATRKEFVHVILGAVEGHKNALDLHILHRDVSGPNVMIEVKGINKECAIPSEGIRDGFLADWGHAIDLNDTSQLRDSAQRTCTGTYPYLSTELMFCADGQNVTHRTCDDLESFFWILWVMSVNYTGPFDQTRDWESIECLMNNLAAEQSGTMVYIQGELSEPVEPSTMRDNLSEWNGQCMLGDPSNWMAGISSRAPAITQPARPISLPSTPTRPAEASRPLPTSTPTPVSLDISIQVEERLRLGLQAQQAHVKKIWQNQLAGNKKTHLHCVGEFTSVPAWAKLGSRAMEYRQVATDKAMLSWDMMKAFITPYFAIPPFLDGMEKLHGLFKGTTSIVKGEIVWAPPIKAPTHGEVIEILKEMLDGLTQELDPYPTAAQIKDGRERYESFLQKGRFPQFSGASLLRPPTPARSGSASASSDYAMTSTGSTDESVSAGGDMNERGMES